MRLRVSSVARACARVVASVAVCLPLLVVDVANAQDDEDCCVCVDTCLPTWRARAASGPSEP